MTLGTSTKYLYRLHVVIHLNICVRILYYRWCVGLRAPWILEWVSLILGVTAGFLLNLNYINVLCLYTGWALFFVGGYINYLSHKAHPKAHESIDSINYKVSTHGLDIQVI